MDVDKQIEQLKREKENLKSENLHLKKVISDLNLKIEELQSQLGKEVIKADVPHYVVNSKTVNQIQTDILGVTPKPNNVNLIVRGKKDELLSGVVGIIRIKDGSPIKASKSNNLGQLKFSASLQNGRYDLKLSKPGYIFPQITLELNGDILSPFVIKAIG